MSDARTRIADLEAEIDELADAVERARKVIVAGRFVVGSGSVVIGLAIWRGDGLLFVTGVAAVLGSLVLSGSTRTSRAQLLDQLAAHEKKRNEIIDAEVRPTTATE